MFKESGGAYFLDDGKSCYFQSGGSHFFVDAEIRAPGRGDKIVLARDLFGRQSVFLESTIREDYKNLVCLEQDASKEPFALVNDNVLAYILFNGQMYRSFELIFAGSQLFHLAVTINGVVRAFAVSATKVLTREEVLCWLKNLRKNCYDFHFKTAIYRKVLLL